ncbi:MAG: hypothetical protein FJY85_13205 [Deltaproteobacteria bacterium]|nr:hypothetical protein [Deltaproteobacteria bacterium]
MYQQIGQRATRLRQGLVEICRRTGWPARDQGPETVFSIMHLDRDMRSVRDLYRCDTDTLMELRRELRARGVYTRPSRRDVWYLSTTHTEQDIDRTLQAAEEAVAAVKR